MTPDPPNHGPRCDLRRRAPRSRRLARSLALACAVSVLGLGVAAPAHAATRWTAPGATGPEPCLESNPCSIDNAIEDAPNPGDEVIVKPGDYTIAAPISSLKSLDIHGQDGQPRPRLLGAFTSGGNLLNLYATPPSVMRVRYLYLEHKAANTSALRLSDGPAVASDVIALATAQGASAIFFERGSGITVRDSVGRTTGPDGEGVFSAATNGDLRNVTAVSSGPDSVGVAVEGVCGDPGCPPNNSHPSTMNAKNVVARGTQSDLRAITPSTNGGEANAGRIDVSYSNYRTTGGSGVVNDQGSNQSAEPLFEDAAEGDFHQLGGSPTIDAGTSDPLNGPTDFDGDSRSLGAAPDIGADEFVDLFAPFASGLGLFPSTFRARNKGVSISARRRGTTVRYNLSEAATVRFRVQRRARGRRVRGRCVRPNRSNRRRRACTRYATLRGSFSHQGNAGPNSFKFSGRLRGRKLRPGRYRLVGTPTDSSGNAGAPVRARFRIVR